MSKAAEFPIRAKRERGAQLGRRDSARPRRLQTSDATATAAERGLHLQAERKCCAPPVPARFESRHDKESSRKSAYADLPFQVVGVAPTLPGNHSRTAQWSPTDE